MVISDKAYQATLQFDESGVWSACALRWTRDYGPGHKFTSYQMFDKTVVQNGVNPSRTFAPHEVYKMGDMLKIIDGIKDGSTMKSGQC